MGQSEQWLRAICSGFGSPGSSGETIWEGVGKRYYERNPPMCKALRESMRPFGRAGLSVIPVHPILYLALEKIVKGLCYHLTHKVAGWTEFDCKVLNFASDNDPDRSNRGAPGISLSDVFKSRFLIEQQDAREVSFWWLEFYQGITFRCRCR